MLKTLTVMLAALLIGCTQEKAPTPIDETPIQLTNEEAKYVHENRVVTWVVEDNRPPFIYTDGTKVHGISAVYLAIISKKTGFVFKPVPVQNFNEGVKAVKTGQIDLMTTIRPTAERAIYFGFTAPYSYNAGVFVFRLNTQPGSPLRAGICQGDPALTYLISRFPDMKITETEDNEEAIALLEKGLLDVAIMNEASANYLSHKSITKMRKASTDFDYPYSFAFKKENAMLGQILSKAIASISLEDKKTINESWQKE